MNTKILAYSFIILTSFLQVGCFEWLNPANKAASTATVASLISSAQFIGALSATNEVTGVLVKWSAATDSSVVKNYNIYRVSGTKKTLLASMAPSLTSYMDGTAIWGTIYSYQVKAVDTNGVEDANTAIVKSLSWAGISAVTAASRTSLAVSITNTATVVDEVRIYGQLGVGGTKTLLATGNGSDTTITIPGLRTGYNYIISAQAYISSLGKEDGNSVSFSATTMTVGYDDDGSDTAQWGNVMQVRAFGEAPAAPIHPNYPNKSPSERVVELVFNAFGSVGTSAKYVVTRVVDGNSMDSSSTATCTNTTESSCLVCSDLTATNGVVKCRDTAVGAAPTKYRYSLSLVHTDSAATWIEPLPSDKDTLEYYSVLVPIPPKNMVLVQRDAANYEMCLQLNKVPIPSRHNRCTYSGVGAVPYSTGHNKPALTFDYGYYDFGYNLFVDRWEMACNWTMNTQGGMCGANHSAGSCIGADTAGNLPSNSIGKIGDVYYMMGSGYNSECFYAYSQDSSGNTNWKRASDIVYYDDAQKIFSKMFTNDPGYIDASGNYDLSKPGRRAKPVTNNWFLAAQLTCSGQNDETYGGKRLSRTREYMAWAAPSLLTGEMYPFSTYSSAYSHMAANAAHSSTFLACDENAYDAVTYADTTTGVAALTSGTNEMTMFKVSSAGYGANQFMIGSSSTIDCQSRYGVQDYAHYKWMNDAFTYNSSTLKLTGIASPYDNGNRDFLSDLSGGTSGFTIDTSKYTSGAIGYTSSSFTGFVPTIGLPLTASTFSADYWTKSSITQPYGLGGSCPLGSSGLYVTVARFRWSTRYDATPTYAGRETRCVLPAE